MRNDKISEIWTKLDTFLKHNILTFDITNITVNSHKNVLKYTLALKKVWKTYGELIRVFQFSFNVTKVNL
jgi:hypothetical protein